MLGELKRVATTLVKPITPIEYIGSIDMETDEIGILAVTWHLALKAQKALSYYERYTKLHQKVTEDALKQPYDQHLLANIMQPPPIPQVLSNPQNKEGIKYS